MTASTPGDGGLEVRGQDLSQLGDGLKLPSDGELDEFVAVRFAINNGWTDIPVQAVRAILRQHDTLRAELASRPVPRVPEGAIEARLGWRNAEPPLNPTQLQVYGPGGRWANGGSGSLEEALVAAGYREGARLLVWCPPSPGEQG